MSNPVMTRRHYKFIAKILHRLAKSKDMTCDSWDAMVQFFANELQRDNPRFDWKKFEKACLYWNEKKEAGENDAE